MSERWETVPVSREARRALMDWAEWLLDDKATGRVAPTLGMDVAAREFREDVLADRRAEMRELDERSPMPGGFPE